MVEWYRPLQRLLEVAPRETRAGRGALRTWLEGRVRAGELPRDDLAFGQFSDVGGRPPYLYENYLTSPVNLDRLRGASESGFARPVLDARGRVAAPSTIGAPQYAAYDNLRAPGSNYREVVIRSPELPGVLGNHFAALPGSARSDDVLGWLRLQDYNPTWDYGDVRNWGQRGVSQQPYTWLDEAQSDRFANLRNAQRQMQWVDRGETRPAAAVAASEAAVDTATRNLAPWTNSWDSLLFRRALEEAYNRPDTQGLAWTSGQQQALRYGREPSAYAPQYDQRFPRLARAEARRLGLPPETVGTAEVPQQHFAVNSPEGLVDTFPTADAAENHIEDLAANSDYPASHFSMSPVNVQVPFHYFNMNDDARRAIERYGLPYFGRGGRV